METTIVQADGSDRRLPKLRRHANSKNTMTDFIFLPSSWLSLRITSDAAYLRAVAYLAAEINENGSVDFSAGDARTMFGMSPRRYRTFMQIITADRHTDRRATNKTTSITFDREPLTSARRQASRQTADRHTDRRATALTLKNLSDTLALSEKYPFVDPMFKDAFSAWLEYKEKQWNFRYKTERSLKSAYQELVKLSGSNPCTAMQIVEQSMSNGWKGLFELRRQYGTTKTTAQTQYDPRRGTDVGNYTQKDYGGPF